MSGQPAARMWDLTTGGPIFQGSQTVLIGSAGGVACAVCPGGILVSNPVNPALGAKVLLGAEDLDFALPGPLPLVWQRQYSSYVNTEHGAACGVLGYGWKLATEVAIEIDALPAQNPASATRLFDAAGRCIGFAALRLCNPARRFTATAKTSGCCAAASLAPASRVFMAAPRVWTVVQTRPPWPPPIPS